MGVEAARVVLTIIETAGELESPWVSGLIGIGGAILGSAVSVVATDWFNRRAKRRDDWEKSRALTFSVYDKLNQIYSDVISIRSRIYGAIQEAELTSQENAARGEERAPDGKIIVRPVFLHSYLEPYANPPGEVVFSADELWAVPKVGGTELLMAITPLDRRHNALFETLARYSKERDWVFEKLKIEGGDGTTLELGIDSDHALIMAKLHMLDRLILQMKSFSDEIAVETFAAFKHLALAYTRPMGPDFQIMLPNPEGEMKVFKASDAPKWRLKWWQLWRKKKPKGNFDPSKINGPNVSD